MQLLKNWIGNEARETLVCVIASAVTLALSLGGWLRPVLPFDIAWVAIVLSGVPIVIGACVGLFRDHDVTADVLVSLALVASVATGEFFAAGEVALIMQIGTLLEDFTAARARKGVQGLIGIMPTTAHVKRENGSTEAIAAADVRVGDTLLVLAGETVPVDGTIVSGETSVDQSSMTGESLPVDKHVGDELMSGTVNRAGVIEMRAERVYGDSSLQRMVALAEATDASRAPIVRLADKWASWMVFIALGCAVAVWLLTGDFMRAVTVLVVFCPCAFVLATPTSIAAAVGNLTKYGVLVRTGDAVERLAAVEKVAFDKTGTLTYGTPRVVACAGRGQEHSAREVLRMAALAEQGSEHPLGKAVVASYQDAGGKLEPAESFKVNVGRGIEARVDGTDVRVEKFTERDFEDESLAVLLKTANEQLAQGATVISVKLDGDVAGIIALADTVRAGSAEAIGRIRKLGITPMLVTGDNARAAAGIAKKTGIESVESDLLPEGKMSLIRYEGAGSPKVCMVGDGVNDALALSSAYAGVAMGGIGSDIAVESSDAVLVSDDISRLPYLLELCRKALRKIKQNIGVSLVLNFTAIVLSGLGVLTPITGALWHNIGSVFVVVNAAMLLRQKDDGSRSER